MTRVELFGSLLLVLEDRRGQLEPDWSCSSTEKKIRAAVAVDLLVFNQAFHLQRDLQRHRFDKVTFQIVAPDDHEFLLVGFW